MHSFEYLMHSLEYLMHNTYAGTESSVRGGPNFIKFFFAFLVDERIEDPNVTINGPLSAHQRNAI